MCFSLNKDRPTVQLLTRTGYDVWTELANLGIPLVYGVMDGTGGEYFHTKSEDWANILSYIYFKYPMPAYQTSRFDCEDFALYLKGTVSAEFGINDFGIAFGYGPNGGGHAFNILRCEDKYMLWEPQTIGIYGNMFGSLFDINSNGYTVISVLI